MKRYLVMCGLVAFWVTALSAQQIPSGDAPALGPSALEHRAQEPATQDVSTRDVSTQGPVPDAGRLFDGLKDAMERLREDRPSPPRSRGEDPSASHRDEAAVRRIVADELSKVNWTGQGADPDTFTYVNRARERDYGEGQETVACVPRHVCVLLFEQGEVIVGAVIGDDESWPLESEYAGAPGHEFAVIALSPQRFGTRSNLVVLTDRRTYRFRLVSPQRPKNADASLDYDELTFFRYPGGSTVAAVDLPSAPAAAPSAEATASRESDEPLFVYRLEPAERRKHRLPGSFEVYRQGEETWVVMSASTRAVLGEWPQVVALGADGEELVANAGFEISEDGSGRYRLPMVPPGLELYRGAGADKRWLRAWHTGIR